ncbi:hypothetical protein [Actinomadura rugatobispora]|uniref:Uncharacterized protein n=1 Tax=Actinomadura rugatobispora TaxID=1994 RepID=A0ABW0ZQJ1_9ACTN|nr:hypothetical protein GCM10010200_036140 [Actinomadura rugatobispora]
MSVTVILTFDTTHSKEWVLRSVMEAVGALNDHAPSRVHAYTDDEIDQGPAVQMVVMPEADGLATASGPVFVNATERADELARNTGGLVVDLPVGADHRKGSGR